MTSWLWSVRQCYTSCKSAQKNLLVLCKPVPDTVLLIAIARHAGDVLDIILVICKPVQDNMLVICKSVQHVLVICRPTLDIMLVICKAVPDNVSDLYGSTRDYVSDL